MIRKTLSLALFLAFAVSALPASADKPATKTAEQKIADKLDETLAMIDAEALGQEGAGDAHKLIADWEEAVAMAKKHGCNKCQLSAMEYHFKRVVGPLLQRTIEALLQDLHEGLNMVPRRFGQGDPSDALSGLKACLKLSKKYGHDVSYTEETMPKREAEVLRVYAAGQVRLLREYVANPSDENFAGNKTCGVALVGQIKRAMQSASDAASADSDPVDHLWSLFYDLRPKASKMNFAGCEPLATAK